MHQEAALSLVARAARRPTRGVAAVASLLLHKL